MQDCCVLIAKMLALCAANRSAKDEETPVFSNVPERSN
jgi:hypothetical protein